jgi:virulence-associated protein VapD
MVKNVLVLCLVLFSVSNAVLGQLSEKDLKKHLAKIEKSKKKGSVELSLDTVFNAGEAYCLLKPISKMLGSVLQAEAYALNKQGEVYVTFEKADATAGIQHNIYRFNFIDAGVKADIPVEMTKNIEDYLVQFNIFSASGINESGMKKMVMIHPSAIKPTQVNINVSGFVAPNNLLERNRNAMIFVMGNEVKQDNQLIAIVDRKSEAARGTILQTIQVKNHLGQLVAVATAEGATSHSWNIITNHDKKWHTVQSSIGKDENDVISYLVKSLYL